MENLKHPYKTFSMSFEGRPRILMKFSNDKTMATVLNTSAKRFGIEKRKYDLRYGNHVLDLSTQLGYSNLPEGAVIELVKTTADNDPSHVIPVKLRFSNDDICAKGRFRLTDSLWKVVKQLIPSHLYLNENNLCIRYFNKTIVGLHSLKKTKLYNFPGNGCLDFVCDRNFEKLSSNSSRDDKNNLKSCTDETFEKNSSQDVEDQISSRSFTASTPKTFPNPSSVSNSTNDLKLIQPKVVNISERYGQIYHAKYAEEIELLNMRNSNENSLKSSQTLNKPKLDLAIRINFPDFYILRAKFNSHETVNDVIKFIKRYLREPNNHFYLYTTHPKLLMTPDRYLKDIKCYPKRMLFFSSANRNETQNFLRECLMAGLTGPKIPVISWNNNSSRKPEYCLTPPKKSLYTVHAKIKFS